MTSPHHAPAGTVERIDDGLIAIDTMTGGLSKVTAGYLVEAPRPALIECGPALSVQSVIAALRQLGMEPADLAYLVLSHIHLDHGGGAGDVAAAFPSATVVVSEIGAPHLVDPQRLNASSRRVYGTLMDTVYGECRPLEAERVRGVGDREILDLGGRRLELLATPGHAKHHIAALDPDSGALFVGDSVGVRLPGMRTIRPATPPPDFDYDLAQASLDRYVALSPATVYLAHYGEVGEPGEVLSEAAERLRQWATAAEEAAAEHDELDHVAETLARRFADDLDPATADADAARRVSLLNGPRSNAAGLLRWLHKRAERAPQGR